MLINWTLVEQRRAERGLSRAELARKTRLHPADLLRYDEPGADDSGVTIGTISALAAALGLPSAALLRAEPPASQSAALTQIVRVAGSDPDQYAARFGGDGELTRWHDQPGPGETPQPRPPDGEVAALLAALFLAGEPLSPGELALALGWHPARLQRALACLDSQLPPLGLMIRADGADLTLDSAPRALNPPQRRAVRAARAARGGITAGEAAVLLRLHRDGPLRTDQLPPELQHTITRLEQAQLVRRLGTRYGLTPSVASTLGILTQPGEQAPSQRGEWSPRTG
ncbi:MAG TPA: helix-turn-helix transcriptional regulator [Streptosporangiaceae bacterium]